MKLHLVVGCVGAVALWSGAPCEARAGEPDDDARITITSMGLALGTSQLGPWRVFSEGLELGHGLVWGRLRAQIDYQLGYASAKHDSRDVDKRSGLAQRLGVSAMVNVVPLARLSQSGIHLVASAGVQHAALRDGIRVWRPDVGIGAIGAFTVPIEDSLVGVEMSVRFHVTPGPDDAAYDRLCLGACAESSSAPSVDLGFQFVSRLVFGRP